ncbi:MAG: HupE/UreJ family protein, partial [Gemmatimonas sp.]|uniref:HupE/UreJ family protein n=1 Tax=Gemmatimonas sp. TaxID=1962908 RepID=UPI00391991F0
APCATRIRVVTSSNLPACSSLSRDTLRFARFLSVIAIVVAVALPGRVALAHEIPRHVGVRAWIAPLADRVRLLVQIPMDAVRDVDFPLRANEALELSRAQPFLRDAAQLWVADAITLRDGGRRLPAPQLLAVRAALPSDRAFEQYASALNAVTSHPLADSINVPHGQLRLEVLLEVPVGSPVRDLVIEPAWANLGVRTTTVLTLVNADGTERRYAFDGNPGEVRVDPRWWHAAWMFTREGVHHLLLGYDHLLFLLCLVLPFRQLRPLIGIVSAFTVAHSLTLVASALGFAPDVAWFPPFVEVVIAASIVLMAVGNLLRPQLERRWVLAFVFGLVHGFGFSSALRDSLQFAGPHLLTSLLAFNVGVEVAQVAVLLVAVPVLDRLLTRVPERAAIVVVSAFVAHEAWHWTQERYAVLDSYPLTMPVFDVSLAVLIVRALMALLVLVGALWAVQGLMARLQRRPLVSGGAPGARSGVVAVLLLAAVAWLVPVRAEAQPRTTMAGVYTAEQATKGREVFTSNCLGCHTTATHMGPAFQNKWFGRPLFDLYDYVSQAMPKAAPGSLTEDEYVWVTAYILRLNGMPAGRTELNPEPAWLKAVKVDSTLRAVGSPKQVAPLSRTPSLPLYSLVSRPRARTENP